MGAEVAFCGLRSGGMRLPPPPQEGIDEAKKTSGKGPAPKGPPAGSDGNPHKRLESERIASDIADYEKSGGKVEKLGVTRVLRPWPRRRKAKSQIRAFGTAALALACVHVGWAPVGTPAGLSAAMPLRSFQEPRPAPA